MLLLKEKFLFFTLWALSHSSAHFNANKSKMTKVASGYQIPFGDGNGSAFMLK